MTTFDEGQFDAVVIGAGHAGCEASLALARLGLNTAMITLNLDSIGFMPCNPSIGGTAKGQLVREIDALGGEMGVVADKACMQIRMLNRGKGTAVQSLRGQEDKNLYHTVMKETLENTPNLRILQGEVTKILTDNGKVCGVETSFGGKIDCKAVVVATGVYLNSFIFAGEWKQFSGPNGFTSSVNGLTQSLIDLGFKIRRFKTGTPARIDRRTIDFSKCSIQEGETDVYPFSYLSERLPEKQEPCYLTYTNEKTHEIIRKNLDRSPLYSGKVHGIGPRYCPSIEDKVVRFADKERHQLFLEPEGRNTNEIYVQGLSTSLPHDVQKEIYHSIAGLEHCEIMRYAYAIEYDCIDTLDVLPTLEFKKVRGLFTAGQINGTSGYEEAGGQGLIAGINASMYIKGKPPVILKRNEGYLGVLIDDLVTKGTNEPYRMMTSRAEHRLTLRGDDTDLRLTPIAISIGLASKERIAVFEKRKTDLNRAKEELQTRLTPKQANEFIVKHGGNPLNGGITYAEMIKRGISIFDVKNYFDAFKEIGNDVLETTETTVKYEGYLKAELEQIAKAERLENQPLPKDCDYSKIDGIRLEARQKLDKIRPLNLGQASRISGVSPADITVLMLLIKNGKIR